MVMGPWALLFSIRLYQVSQTVLEPPCHALRTDNLLYPYVALERVKHKNAPSRHGESFSLFTFVQLKQCSIEKASPLAHFFAATYFDFKSLCCFLGLY